MAPRGVNHSGGRLSYLTEELDALPLLLHVLVLALGRGVQRPLVKVCVFLLNYALRD